MGNESCSFPRLIGKDFEVPHLKERNSYGYTNDHPDDKMVRSVFAQSYEQNRKSKVLQMINDDKNHQFQDQKFKLDSKQFLRLSVLFNFETNRTRIYTKKEETDITSFIQLHIQFAYLTSVFYLLSRRQVKAKLLPRLVENQETNDYGAYSSTLFCNGQEHQVVIDDRMPTQNDSFLYLRIVKGIELWPLILQKAWCKQIGGYEAAKGLSPEDAFEQITGIPAYTYTIKANNHPNIKGIINRAIQNRYWITLVARMGLSDLQNRQVFFLQGVEGDQYKIISPYVNYTFEKYHQKRRGEVWIREEDIFDHFEFVVVGFYKEHYVPISVPVTSKKREELTFELNVRSREEVSIRFNQLFQGYFNTPDRKNYQYSPILIELYEVNELNGSKKNCKLINFCQGCSRSLSGSRSSQCSLNIMQPLMGKYIVRLEVDWLYEGAVNRGNLVVYASEGNVSLTQIKNAHQILYKQIYMDIVYREKDHEHDGSNDVILHEHSLEIKTFDKEKSTLLLFHNKAGQARHFKLDFFKSKNVYLKGDQVNGNVAYIRLNSDQKTIIEVTPEDLQKPMHLENFQINKLEVKN